MPIASVVITTIPKCSESTPTCATSGANTRAHRRMFAIASMKSASIERSATMIITRKIP
jgi:hypothetical protein